MDPLLLLCNLYADGPATLRRLKTRGVSSIAGVAAIAPDRLAEILGGSPAAARRFQREAAVAARAKPTRDLEEGALVEPLACEPSTVEASTFAHDAVAAPVHPGAPAPHALPLIATRRSSGATRIPAMPLDEIAPRAPVLSHKVDSPLAAEFRGTLRPRAPVAHASVARTAIDPAPNATITPRGPRSEPRVSADSERSALDPSTLLRPGLCNGLDATLCAKLIGEGIRTMAQLVRVPTQPLAGWIGLTPEAFEALRGRATKRIASGSSAHADADATPAADGTELDDGSAGERIYELRPAPRAAPPTPVWNDRAAPVTDKTAIPLGRRALPALEDVAGPFA